MLLVQYGYISLVLIFLLIFSSPKGSENKETKISELGKYKNKINKKKQKNQNKFSFEFFTLLLIPFNVLIKNIGNPPPPC